MEIANVPWQAKTSLPEDVRALRKREWAVLGTLLLVAVVAFVNVKHIIVDGISMEPTFHNHESVLVWKTAPFSNLKAGDVIVFKDEDGKYLIKRIVFIDNQYGTATPPSIIITRDGPKRFSRLFVYYYYQHKYGWKEYTKDQRIYVMGDNTDHSYDSRWFGPIRPSQVIGKVLF